MEHWIAKYIPQNKTIYSDHFTPGKIKEITDGVLVTGSIFVTEFLFVF
jgi:hypothetical protein